MSNKVEKEKNKTINGIAIVIGVILFLIILIGTVIGPSANPVQAGEKLIAKDVNAMADRSGDTLNSVKYICYEYEENYYYEVVVNYSNNAWGGVSANDILYYEYNPNSRKLSGCSEFAYNLASSKGKRVQKWNKNHINFIDCTDGKIAKS